MEFHTSKCQVISITNKVKPIIGKYKIHDHIQEQVNTKHNTNKIEMVQRMCAHYVTGNFDRTSSVTSLLNCLSLPTLEEMRRQYCLAVMYRILQNQVDIHWQSFLTKTSSCTRGHSCRLFVPFCKNHVYASSFFLVLVETGITLALIQLMHHPLTPLPGS